jgi:hypothetical protein
MNFISIAIPTYSYLKKFAESRYANGKDHIYVSTSKSPGIVMWKILNRRNFGMHSPLNQQYDTHLVFMISERYYNGSGFFISTENTFIFNKYLKHQFEESMFDHITINMYNGIAQSIEKEILSYLEYFNITETERTLCSFQKKYQRWRIDRNVKIENINKYF